MRAKFVQVGSKTVRVLYEGSGPPVLLIHPIGHSADLFLRNIDPLAEHFEVIAADLPGHGFADFIDFGDHPVQICTARHLLALMSQLGHATFHAVGSSYGGLIATLMALQAPERIRRLVIVGSNSALGSNASQEKALRAVFANACTAMRSASITTCRTRMGNICFDRTRVAEEVLPIQVTYYAYDDRLTSLEATIESLIASVPRGLGRTYDRLEDLVMPTLAIVGREDVRASWSDHVAAVHRMRDGRCIVFDQCGHLPFMEHPDRFNAEVSAFLGAA